MPQLTQASCTRLHTVPPDGGLDPSDSEFHKTQSNDDRQQLLWSLHPTIKHFLENLEGETVEIDLNRSYKLA